MAILTLEIYLYCTMLGLKGTLYDNTVLKKAGAGCSAWCLAAFRWLHIIKLPTVFHCSTLLWSWDRDIIIWREADPSCCIFNHCLWLKTVIIDVYQYVEIHCCPLQVVYYIFTMVGMELFKGKVQFFEPNSTSPDQEYCGNPLLKGTTFAKLNYCKNNFNNVVSSFIVLLELTVVNQWHDILYKYRSKCISAPSIMLWKF